MGKWWQMLSFLMSALSSFKPQLSFSKIKMSRILVSINLNFGCSSCKTCKWPQQSLTELTWVSRSAICTTWNQSTLKAKVHGMWPLSNALSEYGGDGAGMSCSSLNKVRIVKWWSRVRRLCYRYKIFSWKKHGKSIGRHPSWPLTYPVKQKAVDCLCWKEDAISSKARANIFLWQRFCAHLLEMHLGEQRDATCHART